MFHQDNYQVTRHICPRNCYDSCPMLAYTTGGRIEKITGDNSVPGASSHLCAKGEQILAQVYHPKRILYPMRQKNAVPDAGIGFPGLRPLTSSPRKSSASKNATAPRCPFV